MIAAQLTSDAAKFVIENVKEMAATGINGIIEEAKADNPSPIVKEALESDFDSPSELNLKKATAAAMFIAKKHGTLPVALAAELAEDTAVKAASLADDAISRAKAAFWVGLGKINATQAADRLIDKATARLAAVADKAVEKGVDFAIKKVSTWVAAAYPPVVPVVALVQAYQPLISEQAKKIVRKGIQKLNSIAKEGVRKAWNLVKSTVKA